MARKAKAKQVSEQPEERAEVIIKKSTPGQYAALPRTSDYGPTMVRAHVPGLKGFLIRATMRELEPTQGTYNFVSLHVPLQYCERNGLQLVLMIVDKTFRGGERPLPVYLQRHEIPNRQGGFTAARWRPDFIWRMKALLKAIGLRYDKHPNFEGVSLQETSLSLSDKSLDTAGYTPELYRDGLINVINSANTSMPNTRVFWHMNFLPRKQSYIAHVAAAIAPGQHLMGGPDWRPDAYILKRSCYPFYVQFKDRMTTFIDNQYDSYEHLHREASKTKYWTPDELYDSAKAQIFVDYYFWTYLPKPKVADAYCYTDAIPVIARDAQQKEER